MSTMLIRRNPHHSVVAHVTRRPNGWALLRVTADQGPVPFVDDLVGEVHTDRKFFRNTILARMRALARGEPQITTIDRVLLSPRAVAEWMQIVKGAEIPEHLIASIDIDDIPDEQASPQADGSLLIWVEQPWGGRLEMTVPRDEWRWRDH